MRLLLLILSLFLVTGCGQIKQMNSNMETSNENLTKNTSTVQHSSEVIQKNTEEIARSTDNMKTTGKILPVIIIVLLAVLFYPTLVLFKLQRKILQEIKILVDKLRNS